MIAFLHFTDNAAITGVSIAEAAVDDTFQGVAGTTWGEQPSYRVPLSDFNEVEPPLSREALFNNETIGTRLKQIAESHKGLFYSGALELNQGAYLTEAPTELVETLNDAYVKLAGRSLPHIDKQGKTKVVGGEAGGKQPYTFEQAVNELFLDQSEIEEILRVWKAKKNIILKGPPGVGKTFAARRLAYALSGYRDNSLIEFIQFHQSYLYEDFIEGYRPLETGGFGLRMGRFYEFCKRATANKDTYVFIIDEINRGNLSKIFGELLVLIESDKRAKEWKMPLAYGKSEQRFFVPENVFLLGLMNSADRSLAVVDYALRRRFAFFDLKPKIESEKFATHLRQAGASDEVIGLIQDRIGRLNTYIAGDTQNLGPGFTIGHSFFCDLAANVVPDLLSYKIVVRTEIIPLLEEYWFDNPSRAADWQNRLLAGV